MQRKIISVLLSLLTVACLLFAVGCDEKKTSATVSTVGDTKVLICIDEAAEGTTLIDVLNALKEEDKLTFEAETGAYGAFITSVNGKANVTESASSGSSWMIYTSNAENGYEDFTVTVEGVVYYSAAVGASQLAVKTGETIVLSYEAWSY